MPPPSPPAAVTGRAVDPSDSPYHAGEIAVQRRAGVRRFDTFGNLAVSPAAGLLFVDFERGGTLHLTGTAEVLWDAEQFAAWPGAGRAVRFRVAEVLERPGGSPLRLRLVERSPFDPRPHATCFGTCRSASSSSTTTR